MEELNTFRKYLEEGIDQSQRQEANGEYKGIAYEIWYNPKKGYYADNKEGDIINRYSYFDTQGEAEEHAKMEIDGFVEDINSDLDEGGINEGKGNKKGIDKVYAGLTDMGFDHDYAVKVCDGIMKRYEKL
jgi:hypothetical protein